MPLTIPQLVHRTSSPNKITNQLVRKQTIVLYDCITRGWTSTLEEVLMGTPKLPKLMMDTTAANQPQASEQPEKMESVGMIAAIEMTRRGITELLSLIAEAPQM